MSKATKRQSPQERRAAMLDQIKDEIDSLGDIKSMPHRTAMANELVEYLQLHFNARPGL